MIFPTLGTCIGAAQGNRNAPYGSNFRRRVEAMGVIGGSRHGYVARPTTG
jgi:hypothetical protein